VQTLDQHKARSIGPHQDWGLLALVEHARSDFVYALLFQSRAPFDRYVDIRDVRFRASTCVTPRVAWMER
jgi:hypothetical protein